MNSTQLAQSVLDYELLYSGQKRPYADTIREYLVKSELPQDEVEKLCNAEFGCILSRTQWLSENNTIPSAANHFRNHYTITKRGEGEYLYVVCSPYTG